MESRKHLNWADYEPENFMNDTIKLSNMDFADEYPPSSSVGVIPTFSTDAIKTSTVDFVEYPPSTSMDVIPAFSTNNMNDLEYPPSSSVDVIPAFSTNNMDDLEYPPSSSVDVIPVFLTSNQKVFDSTAVQNNMRSEVNPCVGSYEISHGDQKLVISHIMKNIANIIIDNHKKPSTIRMASVVNSFELEMKDDWKILFAKALEQLCVTDINIIGLNSFKKMEHIFPELGEKYPITLDTRSNKLNYPCGICQHPMCTAEKLKKAVKFASCSCIHH